jgi:hypothetical protein
MLAGLLELFEPQPTSVSAATNNSANANCFIKISPGFEMPKGRAKLDAKFSRGEGQGSPAKRCF